MGGWIQKYLRNQRGITLIELIVSLAIFGIITAPLSGFFTQAVRTNAMASDKLKADQLAQQYLERWKAAPLGEISTDLITEGNFLIETVVTPQTNYIYPVGADIEDSDMDAVMTISKDTFFDKALLNVVNDGTAASPDASETLIIDIGAASYRLDMAIGNYISINGSKLAYTLADNTVNIKILVDADFSTVFDLNNTLTSQEGTVCNIYIVKKAEALGQVQINNESGIVNVFDNIYDDTVEAGLAPYSLYKITVNVYKNVVSADTKLITLESMKKVE